MKTYNHWANCPKCKKSVLCFILSHTQNYDSKTIVNKYECSKLHVFSKTFKLS